MGESSLGSGVIIDAAGDILTSLHVVDGAQKITITFADGTHSDGVVVSAQPEMDIAVLQAGTLPELYVPAVLGNPARCGWGMMHMRWDIRLGCMAR